MNNIYRPDIRIGDLVETCSLMPGVVMKRSFKSEEEAPYSYDDLQVRMLHYDNTDASWIGNDGQQQFSSCSLAHCGIVKITPQQALNRLQIGLEGLKKLWSESNGYEEYYAKVDGIKLK